MKKKRFIEVPAAPPPTLRDDALNSFRLWEVTLVVCVPHYGDVIQTSALDLIEVRDGDIIGSAERRLEVRTHEEDQP